MHSIPLSTAILSATFDSDGTFKEIIRMLEARMSEHYWAVFTIMILELILEDCVQVSPINPRMHCKRA